MTFCFDVDNTLCVTEGSDYRDSTPIKERIDYVNSLYEDGHTIYVLTARGMGSTNNNPIKAYAKYYNLTKEQLDSWNLKYHDLFLGKPCADIFVDDKGSLDSDFFLPKV
jgi:protein tyrosine/serine phosphatase